MSAYVFMKILERAPALYDRGMRLLSRGRAEIAHTSLARAAARPDTEMLDIGCGTAGATIACARCGARVWGIDADAAMVEEAERRVAAAGLGARVHLLLLAAAEIEDRWPEARFDAVVSCLALSEMSWDEQRYVLRTAATRLRPGGTLAVADETRAVSTAGKLWQTGTRAPAAVLTRLLARGDTTPIADLAGLVRDAGLTVVREERLAGDLCLVVANRPEEAPP